MQTTPSTVRDTAGLHFAFQVGNYVAGSPKTGTWLVRNQTTGEETVTGSRMAAMRLAYQLAEAPESAPEAPTLPVQAPSVTRWVPPYFNRFDQAMCPWCGSFSCDQTATVCKLCGARQCMGNGTVNGQCAICFSGLLVGWRGDDASCTYAHCQEPAVARGRGRKAICRAHAERQHLGTQSPLAGWRQLPDSDATTNHFVRRAAVPTMPVQALAAVETANDAAAPETAPESAVTAEQRSAEAKAAYDNARAAEAAYAAPERAPNPRDFPLPGGHYDQTAFDQAAASWQADCRRLHALVEAAGDAYDAARGVPLDNGGTAVLPLECTPPISPTGAEPMPRNATPAVQPFTKAAQTRTHKSRKTQPAAAPVTPEVTTPEPPAEPLSSILAAAPGEAIVSATAGRTFEEILADAEAIAYVRNAEQAADDARAAIAATNQTWQAWSDYGQAVIALGSLLATVQPETTPVAAEVTPDVQPAETTPESPTPAPASAFGPRVPVKVISGKWSGAAGVVKSYCRPRDQLDVVLESGYTARMKVWQVQIVGQAPTERPARATSSAPSTPRPSTVRAPRNVSFADVLTFLKTASSETLGALALEIDAARYAVFAVKDAPVLVQPQPVRSDHAPEPEPVQAPLFGLNVAPLQMPMLPIANVTTLSA